MMDDQITDMTATTAGRKVFLGTVVFKAEGHPYGTHRWRLRATSPQGAERALVTLSENSIYADPRIDYVREYEVEEDYEIMQDGHVGG